MPSRPNPTQRHLEVSETEDHDVSKASFIGISYGDTGQIWKQDGGLLSRSGVATLNNLTKSKDVSYRDFFKSHIPEGDFTLHCMSLQPGQYHPRMARPGDQHPTEMLGSAKIDAHEVYNSARQFAYLKKHLDGIFDVVDPSRKNFKCYGNSIRNLMILICTECENQMRGILRENGIKKKVYTTEDFVKLLEPMRLSEYSVEFSEMPWLGSFTPFENWDKKQPTKSLDWYDRYNEAKHDRKNGLASANINSTLEAFAALWILLTGQYGVHSWRTVSNAEMIIGCVKTPRWRYSDVYTFAYFDTGCISENVLFFKK